MNRKLNRKQRRNVADFNRILRGASPAMQQELIAAAARQPIR